MSAESAVKDAVRAALHPWLRLAVRIAPKLYVRVLSDYYDARLFLPDAEWPARLDDFEDMAPLFVGRPRPNPHAVAAMDVDEAAYLFRALRSIEEPSVIEIGRYKGGGTVLMAAAIQGRGTLLSIDNHALVGRRAQVHSPAGGPAMDSACARVLERFGFSGFVTLAVGASGALTRPERYNAVFFDGDHRYEGVKQDMDWWLPGLSSGGHALFHDVDLPGVGRAVRELGPGFTRVDQVGHLRHYIKQDVG